MIITLSGASGTGKTSIAKALYAQLERAQPLRSITTRGSRPTDFPGELQHVTHDAFAAMESRNEFLWTAALGNDRYGTLRSDIEHALKESGTVWVMVLVPTIIRNLRSAVSQAGHDPETVVHSFLITNPLPEELRKRLEARGDSTQSVEDRMATYADFQKNAEASGVPFRQIPDQKTLEEKIQMVISSVTGA